MINKEVRDLALKIWEYNFLQQPLEKSDCILVLCSHDLRMADFAAKLFLQNWAPYLAFSGGLSGFTAKIFDRSEAEVFAESPVTMEHFDAFGVEGTRRLGRLLLPDCTVEANEALNGVTVAFSLPKGAFATTILREIMKVDETQIPCTN